MHLFMNSLVNNSLITIIRYLIVKVDDILSSLRTNHGILSLCDIVLNHTANETVWLAEQPSATYNLVNSAHLRPAFLLDRCVARLAVDVGAGRWEGRGVPRGVVGTEGALKECIKVLKEVYLPTVRIEVGGNILKTTLQR